MKNLAFEIIGDILIIRDDSDEISLKSFAEEKIQKHSFIKTISSNNKSIENRIDNFKPPKSMDKSEKERSGMLWEKTNQKQFTKSMEIHS